MGRYPFDKRNRLLCALAGVMTCLALGGCLQDEPREQGQWPLTRSELREQAQTPSVALDPGEAAYRKTCIACHGGDGRGNGGKTAADLTATEGVLTKQDADLLASIRDGVIGPIGVMPPHKALLSDDEIAAVLAYVRRSFGPAIVRRDPQAQPGPDGGVLEPTAP